jgi:hypothetical protein
MSLFQTLMRGVSDTAKFLADDAAGNAAVRAVRREHDEWMRTAQLGTPYWTLNPTHTPSAAEPWGYVEDVHGGPYVFVGPAGLGMPNQLKTANGWSSWRIWWEHGALTLVPQQTARDLEAKHWRRHQAEMDRAAQTVLAQAQAELARRYPATAALHS